jgi:hypothetical protein
MSSTLPEVRTRLYKLFDIAAERAEQPYADLSDRLKAVTVAAAVAEALVKIDERVDDDGLGKRGMCLPAPGSGQG